jgi:hypothetical protein
MVIYGELEIIQEEACYLFQRTPSIITNTVIRSLKMLRKTEKTEVGC